MNFAQNRARVQEYSQEYAKMIIAITNGEIREHNTYVVVSSIDGANETFVAKHGNDLSANVKFSIDRYKQANGGSLPDEIIIIRSYGYVCSY